MHTIISNNNVRFFMLNAVARLDWDTLALPKSTSPNLWNGNLFTTLRDRRVAKLFNGYHYVLTILAEIHPGFRSILVQHAQIIIEDNNKPWKPPIYKIVLIDEPTRIVHLIGSWHYRLMNRVRAVGELSSYTREILSDQVREIVKNSDAIALELFIKKVTDEFRQKVLELKGRSELEKICQIGGEKDQFKLKPLYQLNHITENTDGLEESAWIYGVLERNKASKLTTLYNLETEETQLKSTTIHFSFDRFLDLNETYIGLDYTIYGEESGREQYIPGMLRRPKFSYVAEMQERNPAMAASILQIMQSHQTTTVFVGINHLYGEDSILEFLKKEPKIQITQLD